MSRPMDRNNIYHGRGVGGYGPPPSDYGRGGSFYQQQSDYGRGGSYYQKPSDYGRGGSYYQQQSDYVRGGSYYQQSSNYGRGGSNYQQQSGYGRGGSNYQQSSGYTGGSFNISQSGYGGGGYFNNPMIQSYQSPMMNIIRPGEQPSNDNVNYSIPHEHQITTKNFPLNMQCDICHGYGSNENKSFCYFCDICKFNICPECYNKIIKSFTQILHPHQLYMTSVQNKNCDICHSNKNKLFIKCNEGDFNCCINCFRERSDVKIEPTCTAQ